MRRREIGMPWSFGNRSVTPSMSIAKMPSAVSMSTMTSAEIIATGMPPMRAPAGTSSDMGSAISWKFTNAPPSATPSTRVETTKSFVAENVSARAATSCSFETFSYSST